jgi:hypothetical protein
LVLVLGANVRKSVHAASMAVGVGKET